MGAFSIRIYCYSVGILLAHNGFKKRWIFHAL